MDKERAIAALGALAQDTRLDIFLLLVEYRPGGLAAGEISKHLNLSATTLSFHLNQMKQTGLLTCQRKGRFLVYTANLFAIDELTDFLQKNCCKVTMGHSTHGRKNIAS